AIAPYVAPDPAEMAAQEARQTRDRLLAASDWTQVADAPVDAAAWATYRQALRDVPQQAGFPETIVWPEQPQ
ncbi:MAG: phage tail assembly chaperone, partial [Burkholderiaceae bacterium]